MRQWLPVVLFVGLLCGCLRQAAGPGPAQIVSTPPGATVFIDNQFLGVTPLTVPSLSPGVHSVKLERWGYRRHLGLLTVRGGMARLAVALQEERSGAIWIASVPPGAAVTVNGQHRGRTPTVVSGLPAGNYEIRLQLDNCDPWLRTAQLRAAEKMTINAALESPQERFLRDAIAKKPGEAANYTELARHYIIRKKYDQAASVYKSALQRRDKAMESRLYQEMGRAYGGQFKSFEDVGDMDALHTKIIRLFAETGNAMTFYTGVQKYASDMPRRRDAGSEKAALEKIQALERTVGERPGDLASRLELARLYLDRSDGKHAQEQFKLVAQATENNWMTDAEKEKDAAQRAKGLVKVDGRWVSAKEAERLALAKFPAEERARRAPEEQAQRVALERAKREAEEQARKAKREAEELARKAKREAQELARKEQAEKAKRDAEELAKKEQAEKDKREAEKTKIFASPLAPKEPEWVMNTSAPGVNWQPETWADPATLKVVPYNSGKALNIAYPGGKNAKACVSLKPPSPVDLSSRDRIVLDVVNDSKTLAALSVLITADQDYESPPQFVRPGGHQTLVFPIAGSHFKCPRDNWKKYGFPIAQPKNVTRIALMLNSPANLFVKNVKLTK